MIVDFKTHCIMLNGPPRSGKDSFADAVVGIDKAGKGHVIVRASFGQVLRQSVRPFTCATGAPNDPREWDRWYREKKDIPMHEILNVPRTIRTLRDVMIDLSEKWAKDNFGQNIYGKIVLRQWLNIVKHTQEKHGNDEGIGDLKFTLVITDLGFTDEAKVLLDFFPPEEVTIVQVHREGCDFFNDSRSYVELPNVVTWNAENREDTVNQWYTVSQAVVRSIWENREHEQRRVN